MKFPLDSLTQAEKRMFDDLKNPRKIQDFLESLPINFEKRGETIRSPRRVLRDRKAHCLEGALFAAAALWYHGHPPLLMDLKTGRGDSDHVVAPFRENGRWGALSKTNHAVLRYRDPVYRRYGELALSFFHEYFLDDGRKTMRSYSAPFDLRRVREGTWVTAQKDLWSISRALDRHRHVTIVDRTGTRLLRPATVLERATGALTEWHPSGKRRTIKSIHIKKS